MEIFSSIQVKLILAFLVGAVIGLERQFTKEVITESGDREGPGIRSFGLISLLGASVVILELDYNIRYIILVGFISVLVIIYVYLDYYIKLREELNLTTSIAAILAFVLGMFVGLGGFYWALIISVFITAILSIKKKVVEILRALEYSEITSALQIAIIGLVFMPIIPPITILGALNLQVFVVFMLFVLVVEFLGYIAMRHLGEEKGIVALAMFGAFVHSESTAMEITRIYRKSRLGFPPEIAAASILIVELALVVRSIIFLGFLTWSMPIITMIFAMATLPSVLIMGAYMYIRYGKNFRIELSGDKILTSPLSYKSAIKFATILFLSSALVVLIRGFSYELTFLAVFLGGFFSVTGIELAVASMLLAGKISLEEGLELISIGLIAGIINKPIYVKFAGGEKRILLKVIKFTIAIIAIIAIAVYLTLCWFNNILAILANLASAVIA